MKILYKSFVVIIIVLTCLASGYAIHQITQQTTKEEILKEIKETTKKEILIEIQENILKLEKENNSNNIQESDIENSNNSNNLNKNGNNNKILNRFELQIQKREVDINNEKKIVDELIFKGNKDSEISSFIIEHQEKEANENLTAYITAFNNESTKYTDSNVISEYLEVTLLNDKKIRLTCKKVFNEDLKLVLFFNKNNTKKEIKISFKNLEKIN